MAGLPFLIPATLQNFFNENLTIAFGKNLYPGISRALWALKPVILHFLF